MCGGEMHYLKTVISYKNVKYFHLSNKFIRLIPNQNLIFIGVLNRLTIVALLEVLS